jgi:fatty-acyl-CoA synthase
VKLAFSNLAAPGWSLERTVEAVAEYGYDGLELRLLDGEPIDPLQVSDEVRRSVPVTLGRVPLVCLDTSIELGADFDDSLPAALELAREWGAPLVRVFGGAAGDLDDVARRLAPALDVAERLGVVVALETHDSFSSARRVAELLGRVPSHALGALWDFHHPYRLGESPSAVLEQLGGRIVLVHVKDARRAGDDWQLVPLGEGEVPVGESLAALRTAGYDGWVSVEWEKRWHPELAEPEVALPQHAAMLRPLL